jgi:hypothetical protein
MTANYWIKDRLPTEKDADSNGDVQIKISPYFETATTDHWSQVAVGAFWRHTRYWNPQQPQQADRIAALEQRVLELEKVVDYLIKRSNSRRFSVPSQNISKTQP